MNQNRPRGDNFSTDCSRKPPEGVRQCIQQAFEAQAFRRPQAIAVQFRDTQLTYGELNHRANQLAHHLLEIGVGPEAKVPVCFEKSLEYTVAILAILKAGGCFVPMDPLSSQERCDYVIGKVDALMLLFSSRLASKFGHIDKPKLEISMSMLERLPEALHGPWTLTDHRNAAYIIFTSGSTGVPKGVVIEHGSACSTVAGFGPFFEIENGSKMLQFSSYTFDASLLEIFTALTYGACLCVLTEEQRLDDLAAGMKEMGVTRASLTPTVMNLIKPDAVPKLRFLASIGEALPPHVHTTWAHRVRLMNFYGPTETSMVCMVNPCLSAESNPLNIGKPVGCQIYIADVDDYRRLVAEDAIGEIIVRGPAVGRQYVGDVTTTESAFIMPPPWLEDAEDGEKLYRTGDLGHFLPNGDVCYDGRLDQQVKLHGRRVELGEIEHHLRACDGIDQAVVVLDKRNGGPSLAAFVTISAPAVLSFTEDLRELLLKVRACLAKNLPSVMVPKVILPINHIPQTTSGKTNRRILLDMLVDPQMENQQVVFDLRNVHDRPEPTGDLERDMCALWAKVLQQDPSTIGGNDNFIGLGGDSISAMHLVAAARKQGFALSVAHIFKYPELSAMAQHGLKKFQGAEPTIPHIYQPFGSLGLSQAKLDEFLEVAVCKPLSCGKCDFEDVFEGTDFQADCVAGLYGVTYAKFDLSAVDPTRLEASCRRLLSDVADLRTVFTAYKRKFFQVVLQPSSRLFQFQHYKYGRSLSIERATQMLIEMDSKRPCSMGFPNTRFIFIDGGEGNSASRLLIRISHAHYDGFSLPYWQMHLAAAYEDLSVQPRPSFAQFIDTSKMMEDQAKLFWQNLLKDSSMTYLHGKPRKPPYQSSISIGGSRKIPHPSLNAHGFTFPSVITAAWSLVLSELSGNSDVVFAEARNGRNLPMDGIEKVLGCVLNIVPVRVQLSSVTVLDLLHQVQSQRLDGLPFETMGWMKIVERCTSWLKSTRPSTAVTHQIFPSSTGNEIKVIDTQWTAEMVEPSCDGGEDLSVITTPIGEEILIEIALNPDSASLGEELLDRLCGIIGLMPSNLEATPTELLRNSKSPNTLTRMPPLSPGKTEQQLDKQVQVVLRDLTPAFEEREADNMCDIHFGGASPTAKAMVEEIWNAVFSIGPEKFPNDEISNHTPFYDLWGNLVGAMQLAASYQKEGFNITHDDILKYPTLHLQTLLLTHEQRFRT